MAKLHALPHRQRAREDGSGSSLVKRSSFSHVLIRSIVSVSQILVDSPSTPLVAMVLFNFLTPGTLPKRASLGGRAGDSVAYRHHDYQSMKRLARLALSPLHTVADSFMLLGSLSRCRSLCSLLTTTFISPSGSRSLLRRVGRTRFPFQHLNN